MNLDPNLRADANPPSVQEFLEVARQKLPPRVVVSVAALPAHAEVQIDGRPVTGGTIAVVPGAHQLVARAKAYKTLVKSFESESDLSLPVSLTPALAPARAPVPTTRVGDRKGKSPVLAYSLFGVAAVSAASGFTVSCRRA